MIAFLRNLFTGRSGAARGAADVPAVGLRLAEAYALTDVLIKACDRHGLLDPDYVPFHRREGVCVLDLWQGLRVEAMATLRLKSISPSKADLFSLADPKNQIGILHAVAQVHQQAAFLSADGGHSGSSLGEAVHRPFEYLEGTKPSFYPDISDVVSAFRDSCVRVHEEWIEWQRRPFDGMPETALELIWRYVTQASRRIAFTEKHGSNFEKEIYDHIDWLAEHYRKKGNLSLQRAEVQKREANSIAAHVLGVDDPADLDPRRLLDAVRRKRVPGEVDIPLVILVTLTTDEKDHKRLLRG
jgi:hypothetical protein